MKKIALIIVLTVSLGLAGAIMVDEASAFGFFGRGFGGGLHGLDAAMAPPITDLCLTGATAAATATATAIQVTGAREAK